MIKCLPYPKIGHNQSTIRKTNYNMNSKEVKSILREIEFENRSRELRAVFLEKGVKFYDKDGWGYIKNRIKTYVERY